MLLLVFACHSFFCFFIYHRFSPNSPRPGPKPSPEAFGQQIRRGGAKVATGARNITIQYWMRTAIQLLARDLARTLFRLVFANQALSPKPSPGAVHWDCENQAVQPATKVGISGPRGIGWLAALLATAMATAMALGPRAQGAQRALGPRAARA